MISLSFMIVKSFGSHKNNLDRSMQIAPSSELAISAGLCRLHRAWRRPWHSGQGLPAAMGYDVVRDETGGGLADWLFDSLESMFDLSDKNTRIFLIGFSVAVAMHFIVKIFKFVKFVVGQNQVLQERKKAQ